MTTISVPNNRNITNNNNSQSTTTTITKKRSNINNSKKNAPKSATLMYYTLVDRAIFKVQQTLITQKSVSQKYLDFVTQATLQPPHCQDVMDERVLAGFCAFPACNGEIMPRRNTFCSEYCEARGGEWMQKCDQSMPYARSKSLMSPLLRMTLPSIDPLKIDQLREQMVQENHQEASKVVSLRVKERVDPEPASLDFKDAETIETITEETNKLKSTSSELKKKLNSMYGSELEKRMEAMKVFDDDSDDSEDDDESEDDNEGDDNDEYGDENIKSGNKKEKKKKKIRLNSSINDEEKEKQKLEEDIRRAIQRPERYTAVWTDLSRWVTRHTILFLRPELAPKKDDASLTDSSKSTSEQKMEELKEMQTICETYSKLGMHEERQLMEEAIIELKTSLKHETYSSDPLPERDDNQEQRFLLVERNIHEYLGTIGVELALNAPLLSSFVFDLLNTFTYVQSVTSSDSESWHILALLIVKALLAFKANEIIVEAVTNDHRTQWNAKLEEKMAQLGLSPHQIRTLYRILTQGVY